MSFVGGLFFKISVNIYIVGLIIDYKGGSPIFCGHEAAADIVSFSFSLNLVIFQIEKRSPMVILIVWRHTANMYSGRTVEKHFSAVILRANTRNSLLFWFY